MGFVPGYENDVFISYAHVDNDPTIKGKDGWVDFFEDLLRKRVRVKLGGEINIFRDPQLRQYGEFSEQLAGNLARSAIFLCILSPRYVGSDWCLWELEQFTKQTGHSRLIKVVKTAFDEQMLNPKAKPLLEQIKHVLDCRFYKKDDSSGLFTDLQPEVIPEHTSESLGKIDIIAQNLVELLNKLRASQPQTSQVSAAEKRPSQAVEVSAQDQITVYLAETTKDLVKERDSVLSELVQFNYRVLPDQPLPQDADELSKVVRNHLQQARLSVHLVGASYGIRPEGEDRSIPHIQFDLAAESRQAQLTQIVWLPTDLTPKDKSQQDFVANLKNNSPDYLQTKLEDLKTVIRKKTPTGGGQRLARQCGRG